MLDHYVIMISLSKISFVLNGGCSTGVLIAKVCSYPMALIRVGAAIRHWAIIRSCTVLSIEDLWWGVVNSRSLDERLRIQLIYYYLLYAFPFSPLHDAIDSNNIDIIRLLLSYGADISLETYSGIKSFQLARSQQVKEFLKGNFQ